VHDPAHPDEPEKCGGDEKHERAQGPALDQLTKTWNEKACERRDNVSGGSLSYTHA
jgi:hypothetical protein